MVKSAKADKTQEKLRQLEVEQKYLSIVSEFAVKMLSLTTVEQVIWHIAKHVVAQLGFDDVVIYLIDDERQVLIQHAAFGDKNPAEYQILAPIEIKVGDGIVGKVAQSQKPLLVNDTRRYADYIVDDQNRLSELAVPMVVDNQVIGVIDSEHCQLNYYSEQHLRILEAIASIAAIKIVKTQTIDKLQSTIAQLEYSGKIQDTLFEIAELIFETESMTAFYRRLHACIGQLTLVKNFFVALQTEDGTGLTLPYCIDEVDDVPENEFIPLDENSPSITGYALQLNKPLLVYEQDIKALIDGGKIHLRGSLPKAWLGAPFCGQELKGIVVVQSYTENYLYQEKDKQLLAFVARHVLNAIERMKAKADLKFLALHDPLTRLPNRLLFLDRMDHAIKKISRRASQGLAVLFLDLDRFKQVNDQYGHDIGDKLLINTAHVINDCLRESDTLCRLGGDEFAILLEDISDVAQVKNVTRKIISNVQKTMKIDDYAIDISISIGATTVHRGNIESNALLVQADEAMYQAKLLGRNQTFYYQHNRGAKRTASYRYP